MYDKIRIKTVVEGHWIQDWEFFKYRQWKKDYPGQYFPTVWPTNWNREEMHNLTIEFSMPKLWYGNNILEVNEFDVYNIITKLQKQLRKMRIIIPVDVLWCKSLISNLEICKNINVDEVPVWVLIDYFRKLPPPCRFMILEDDIYKAQRRIGQCRFVGERHEVTCYDKTREVIDRPQSNIAEFYCYKPMPNILRFEVRLKKEALQSILGKEKGIITLSDLAHNYKLYDKVIEKYWKPFVKASKYIPIYASPEVQLAQIKHKLSPEEYKNLLLFKFLEEEQGFIYAKEYFKRELKENIPKITALYRKYPLVEIVKPRYQLMDKLDQIISHPRWWRTMEDVFKPNEQPFEFTECLVQDWWSTKDSAKYLGIGERAVQNKCRDGEIPCCLVGGKYRLKKSDVMNYLYQQKLAKKNPETI